MKSEPLSGNPEISVVVPVYNGEKYLAECVNSVLAQTFPRFELILVDDGSTDRTGELCDTFAKKDPRVRAFHQPNGGVSSARKLGVEKARGEWICFVDGDDLLLPGALGALFAPAKDPRSEIDLVEGGHIRTLQKTPARERPENDAARGNEKPRLASALEFAGAVASYRLSFSPAPHGKIIRKTLFAETAALDVPAEIFFSEDCLMNLRLAKKIRTAARIRADVYFYRENPAGVCRTLHQRGAYTRDFMVRYMNFSMECFAEMSEEWQDVWKILIVAQLGNAYLFIPDFRLSAPEVAPFVQALRERPDLVTHLSTKLALLKTKFPVALVPDKIYKRLLRALFFLIRNAKQRRRK